MAIQVQKVSIANTFIFVQALLVYRKIYKCFYSHRYLLDLRLKFDICHFLNFLVLGMQVGDSFIKRNLDSIFRKIDLVSKKEKLIQERAKKL